MNEGQILIIAGLGRSGTSLTAAVLQNMGLNIGKRLLRTRRRYRTGHSENLDFIGFHKDVLSYHGYHEHGWFLGGEIQVPEPFISQARRIVHANSLEQPWGWKDPRTVHFLSFWANLLPGANFLLVYRSPWEVVDSYFRINSNELDNDPEFPVKLWIAHNQILLAFLKKFPNRCVLLEINCVIHSLLHDQTFLLDLLNDRFAIKLRPPLPSIFDASEFHSNEADLHHAVLIAQLFPEALRLYNELKTLAVYPSGMLTPPPVHNVPFHQSALRNWQAIRKLEAELQQSQSLLYLLKRSKLGRLAKKILGKVK